MLALKIESVAKFKIMGLDPFEGTDVAGGEVFVAAREVVVTGKIVLQTSQDLVGKLDAA